MTRPVVGPDLDREIRRLMRQADIGYDEARKVAVATHVADRAPDRAELQETHDG